MDTLKLSFALNSAYSVNSLLYRLRRFPVIKRLFKSNSYAAADGKIIWAVVAGFYRFSKAVVFAGLYYALIALACFGRMASEDSPSFDDAVAGAGPLFVGVLMLLTIIGALFNNLLIEADYEGYYAIRLLRVDAKKYILINYALMLAKKLLLGILFIFIVCLIFRLPMYMMVLLPLYIVGAKLIVSFLRVRRFETRRVAEATPFGSVLSTILLLAVAACIVFLFIGVFSLKGHVGIAALVALAVVLLGIPCALYLLKYDNYLVYFKRYLNLSNENRNTIDQKQLEAQRKQIDEKTVRQTSRRSGFAFFSELFDLRHRKLLHNSTMIITAIIAIACVAVNVSFVLIADTEMFERLSNVFPRILPALPFVLYIINRGSQYSQALFTNCDRAMLHYAFYRKPANLLKLFSLRLTGIARQNLLPALAVSLSLVVTRVLLYMRVYGRAGLEKVDILELVLFFVAPLVISIFFSVHYLMLYYLLQPFDIEAKSKHFGYNFVMFVTYFACYMSYSVLSTLESVDPLVYGGILAAFCIAYSILACVLVYFLAPKTFKNRV
jgi:hypothetical protein